MAKTNYQFNHTKKKLEVLQRELQSFKPSIEKVNKLASSLIERNHFDSENIKSKQDSVNKQYDELHRLAKDREVRLQESKLLFEYLRETEDLHEWINDQMAVTASEDYGEDVEHVEQLILVFETFVSNLTANENRVQAHLQKGHELIKENNPYRTSIKTKRDETKQLWDELKDLVSARKDALDGAKQVHVYDRVADETISLINEKEANLISEDYGQDLESIQALNRKHLVFETELEAIREQVNSVMNEANNLAEIYPDAKEHIEVKRDETIEAWSDVTEKSNVRKEKLQQAEQLQSYFDEYRDLIAWINEMLAKITAPDLATTVAGAESLLASIKEHHAEIRARDETFANFKAKGEKLIREKHFLAHEIEDKIQVLQQRHDLLEHTLQQRKEIYELNLDTQMFLKDADILENWIVSREPLLKDIKVGDSIPQVEDLLRRHSDFEKTVEAQEEKFQAIKRITLLEQRFRKQVESEKLAKLKEKERLEKERLEMLKQKELQRLNEERRRAEKQMEHRNNNNNQEKTPIFSNPMVTTNTGSSSGTPQSTQSPLRPSFDDDQYGLQKSSSSNIFGDRLRRGSDQNVKRAESMKVQQKQPKRTPSFTTRRRAQSFRKNQKGEGFDLPPVEIQGMLERKHGLQSGGKKAPVRSWKQFHTVLCGQLLCFFKDENDFLQQKTANAPVSILGAKCERAEDYTKKKYVFRLKLPDGSEFLFEAPSLEIMNDWVRKISFHASLPPNLQLLSYDESMKQQSNSFPDIKVASGRTVESPVSSRASSPDSQKRAASRSNSMNSSISINSTSTPQMNFLQKQMQQQQQPPSPSSPTGSIGFEHKPPIPPRGAPPPVPNRQSTDNLVILRNPYNASSEFGGDNIVGGSMSRLPNGSNDESLGVLKRNSEARQSENPPPLPTTMPPLAAAGQQQQLHQHQAQVQQRINAFNAAAATGQHPDHQGNYVRVQQQQLQQQQQTPHHKMIAAPRGSLGGVNPAIGRADVVTKFIEIETATGLQQQMPPVVTSTKRKVHTTISTSSNSSMGSSSPNTTSSNNNNNSVLITRSNSNNNGKHQHHHHHHHANNNNNLVTPPSSYHISTTSSSSSFMSAKTTTTSSQHSRTVWHYTTTGDSKNTIENNSINNPSYMSVISNNNSDGWGTSRFEPIRPVSLQPDSINLSRVSAESSSESEAQSISSVSGVKGSKHKEHRASGMFRIFGRKGGDKEKEKEKDKRRSSHTPQ